MRHWAGPARILVIRTDRIGDVILSTPAVRSIRKAYPGAFLSMMVSSYTRDLVVNNPDIDLVIVDDHRGVHKGIRGFIRLVRAVRKHRFDTAVAFHVNFRLSLLLVLAGIPYRVGPRSNASSLLLNHSVRQSRSRIEAHEARYNLELAHPIGASATPLAPVLEVSDQARSAMQDLIHAWGVNKKIPLIGIHPGSGGSSRNWPLHCYAGLIDDLARAGNVQVCITAAPWESNVSAVAKEHTRGNVFTYAGTNGLDEFAALVEHLDVFVSGSTGPMHMAAALGVPLVALFCPRVACSPTRWGPLTDKKIILMPEVDIRCDLCKGERCRYYDCMETITVENVRSSIVTLLEKFRTPRP